MVDIDPVGLPGRLRTGQPLFNAWLTVPHADVIHEIAQAGFTSVTFDLQHGLMGEDGMYAGLATCHAMGLLALVRLPLGGFSLAARALDAGASGVIAPMINSSDDAEALVEATKFPPVGRRSWGPSRAYGANRLERSAYLHRANDLSSVFVMIESEEALLRLEAILPVEGIDGVFVGPNDLSVSISRGRQVDVQQPAVVSALEKISLSARKHHKVPAVFANTPELAREYAQRGFRMISLGTDMGFLRTGARAALNTAMRTDAS